MKSRPFKMFAVMAVAALLITSVAEAQQERDHQDQGARRGRRGFGGFGGFRGRRGRGGNFLFLLRVKEVREEIKLTETQDELVKFVEEEVSGDQPRPRFNFRDATDEEREKYFSEQQARAKKKAKAAKEMLATVLSKDQVKRLTEISIQQQGIGALNDSDVVKLLKITPEQKEKIEKTQQANREERRAKRRELFQDGGFGSGNFQEMREKRAALRTEADKKVLAELTPEQQKQFEAMKGEKFEMPRRSFGGRRGFGRGRRQGRPGRGEGDRPSRPRRPESDG
jgi:Spy/CpxP family protein refolding chaperone